MSLLKIVKSLYWQVCTAYLKLRPGHRHVDSVCVWPPSKIFLVVRVAHRVIKLLVDLRQPSNTIWLIENTNTLRAMSCFVEHDMRFFQQMQFDTYVGSSLIFKHLWIWNSVSLNVCSRCASFRWHLSKTSVMSCTKLVCFVWWLQFQWFYPTSWYLEL